MEGQKHKDKMKIFCHPDNVNSLKLLIAKEVGGVANVALESVHPETRVVPFLTSPTLPVLQLDDGEVSDDGSSERNYGHFLAVSDS